MEAWLDSQIESAGTGPGTTRRVALPAGQAIVIERVARADTPSPWRLAAYAIQTPIGVAYLLVDGPPAAWEGHEADVALIPLFIEFGPGT